MINTENLTKGFGAQLLFDKISFKINLRERVGLVGRNGYGKTTLFRIITGKVSPDSGKIIIPKYYRIGYVRQHIEFTEDTVLKEGMKGLNKEKKDHSWEVEKILAGLGFSVHDMQRHPSEFSGGYQVRLNLAKVLVSEPDLLLLDEPTNYLDITSIRWIEGFLLNWPRELMLITHDRSFMDKLVTHTLGIHRKKLRKIAGNTEKYYTQLAQDEEIYEKTRINDERKRKEIEQFISRFRAKARLANMVQSRIKTITKMEKKEKLRHIKTLDFSFKFKAFKAKTLMNATEVSFSYDPNEQLIKKFGISIGSHDRVCVIGQNGKGKTTLLKLFAGTLKPQNGEISFHHDAVEGLFEQTNIKTLVDTRTLEEEILYSHPSVDRQLARNICASMMFEGDNVLKKISVLSGGEKSRIMLGKLLVTPVNLLLLDEPTNHLDMESCDALLSALDNFEGAVIMVTHNEMFLHTLAQRLIVFQDNSIFVFEGSYQEFLDKCGWKGEKDGRSTLKKDDYDEKTFIKLSKKELKRRRSEFVNKRARILNPIKKQIDSVENNIAINEKLLTKLNKDILEASQEQDSGRITKISQSIHKCNSEIDRLFDELEKLTDTLEEKTKEFESDDFFN
ncbi:ABC transporter ATP-binding protein [Candidatus Magnetomoraceae bacterium gMMP-15]